VHLDTASHNQSLTIIVPKDGVRIDELSLNCFLPSSDQMSALVLALAIDSSIDLTDQPANKCNPGSFNDNSYTIPPGTGSAF